MLVGVNVDVGIDANSKNADKVYSVSFEVRECFRVKRADRTDIKLAPILGKKLTTI